MNIIFITDSLRRGGKERQLTELALTLKELGYNITIIVFDKNIAYKEIYKSGISIIVLDKSIRNFYKAGVNIFKIIKRKKPVIVHSWSSITTILAIPAKLYFDVPLIDSIRYAKKIEFLSKKWFFSNFAFSFADVVVANSKAGLLTHSKKENKKYKVIYNGYNFNRNYLYLDKKLLYEEFSIKNNSIIVGMIANFQKGKDHLTFIEAAQKLLIENNNLIFMLIGDGPTKDSIEGKISYKFKKHFMFLGSRNDVERIVNIFDIGVLLSNINFSREGISNSLTEIMAAGKPVVATNAGGNIELVLDGVEGFLIEPFDKDSLVDKLKYLIYNKAVRITMGNNAKKKIEKMFGNKKMVENYQNLYHTLLK